MAELRRDHNFGAPASDEVAELLQHKSVKVDLEDCLGRSLRGRNTRSMDDTGDFAKLGGRLNESLNRAVRGNIDRCGADVEAGIEKNFRCGVGVFLPYVGSLELTFDPLRMTGTPLIVARRQVRQRVI